MRIVTLNTWKNEGDYSRRLRLICDGLAALAPDVVCLQEAFVGAGQDTAAAVSRHLGLTLHAAPARAKLRLHEGRLADSTSGLALLTRGVAQTRVLALPDAPADGERIAQSADLVHCGRPLRVLNLHLTHLQDAQALRAAQLQAALDWAAHDLAGALVLAGDLNATARSPELAPLRLAPAPSTLHGAHVDGPHAGGPERGGHAIDHCILIRAGGWREVRTGRALDRPDPAGWFPSDHAAVVLDLEPVR